MRQAGLSLISLLVGLLLGSIALLGMMTTFRNTVNAVIPASEAARSEGERIAVLLSSHLRLHDAGFGILGASAEQHLVVLSDAVLTPADDEAADYERCIVSGEACVLSGDEMTGAVREGNVVLWAYEDEAAGERRCEGLFANVEGWMAWLRIEGECHENGPASLIGSAWIASPLVQVAQGALGSLRQIEFSVSDETCHPLGMVGSGLMGTVRVDVTYELPYSDDGSSVHEVVSSSCLTNFSSVAALPGPDEEVGEEIP